MVLELRSGFSRALLELNQIQLGDTELQNQLEETRHGCNKRTLHLETLILTLKVTQKHAHRPLSVLNIHIHTMHLIDYTTHSYWCKSICSYSTHLSHGISEAQPWKRNNSVSSAQSRMPQGFHKITNYTIPSANTDLMPPGFPHALNSSSVNMELLRFSTSLCNESWPTHWQTL